MLVPIIALAKDMKKSKTILVIGGCGYIGSHMVKCLLEVGHQVIVLDDLSTGYRDSLLGGVLVVGNCGDRARLVADSSQAKRMFGWKPKYAELETIVRHAWQWEQIRPTC